MVDTKPTSDDPPPPHDFFDLWLEMLFACTVDPILELARAVRTMVDERRGNRDRHPPANP